MANVIEIARTQRPPASPGGVTNRRTAISLSFHIETPENVILTYTLAGPFQRFVAYGIDYAIRAALIVAGFMLANILSILLPGVAFGGYLVVGFLLDWCYNFLFEYFWNGQTPGKAMQGLRVIQDDGRPVAWWSSVIRNLARSADTLPVMLVFPDLAGLAGILPLYGPAFISMLLTRKLQRLGDLAAKTVVIAERTQDLPKEPVILDRIEALPRSDLGSFVPSSATLAVIDQFLSRRAVLSYDRGHALARQLAEALAHRLNYKGDATQATNYPMAFLARVFATFARPDEDEQHQRPTKSRRS